MTRLDDLEQMHRVPSWIELAIISDAVHDREGAERAADELFSMEERIKEIENEKYIHCGIPLGYHPEEDVTDWCDKPAATGICGDHWNEFMKLTRKPTLPLPPKKE